MTDWATRVSTPDNPLKEMEAPGPAVDADQTIAAIRKLIHEQAHLLPPDVVAVDVPRRRLAGRPEVKVPHRPDLVELAAPEQPQSKGVLAMLRGLRR